MDGHVFIQEQRCARRWGRQELSSRRWTNRAVGRGCAGCWHNAVEKNAREVKHLQGTSRSGEGVLEDRDGRRGLGVWEGGVLLTAGRRCHRGAAAGPAAP